jgi:hypothetical protein
LVDYTSEDVLSQLGLKRRESAQAERLARRVEEACTRA